MRRLLAILLCSTCFVLSSKASAQDSAGTSDQSMNAHFGPISLLVGSFMVGLDFAIDDNWTLGPQANYWNFTLGKTDSYTSDISFRQYSFGARGNWFKNGIYTDGLYLSPQLDYKSMKAWTRDSIGEVSGSVTGMYVSALVGYGWFWDSFNMMLGAGGTIGLGNRDIEIRDSNGKTQSYSKNLTGLDAEFQIGWLF